MTVDQVYKKFPAFYGTRDFITLSSRARHWTRSQVNLNHSTHSQSVYLTYTLIIHPMYTYTVMNLRAK
jgi:hypothetical protein